MRKADRFRPAEGWWGRLRVKLGLAPRYKRFPVFGIQAAGKSYFILSLAFFISERRLGEVSGKSADFIRPWIPRLLRGEPLDATAGYSDIDLLVRQVYQADFSQIGQEIEGYHYVREESTEERKDDATLPSRFLIATNDLPGQQFKDAMELLSEPTARFGGDRLVQRLLRVFEGGDGAIIVVDVVRRRMTPEEFRRDYKEHIRNALAEQVVPIVRGIELLLQKGNRKNKVFPLFLVFTKRDIHQLSRSRLRQIFDEVFSMDIARLEDRVRFRIHSVQSIGFGEDPESIIDLKKQTEGVGLFLADLSFSIRDGVR